MTVWSSGEVIKALFVTPEKETQSDQKNKKQKKKTQTNTENDQTKDLKEYTLDCINWGIS